MTPIVWASLAIQAALYVFDLFAPPARPENIQKLLNVPIFVTALICTTLGVSLYPVALRTNPLVISVLLVGLAVLSPFAGLLEARYRRNGQAVYSTGKLQGTSNRFPGHLLTSILSALATSALVVVVHSTVGFDAFVAKFSSDAAFNVLLPLSSILAFAYVRWQQVDACPDVDQLAAQDREDAIVGFSLRHLHEIFLVFSLTIVSFVAATTVVYLFAFAMTQAKSGHPLSLSWQVISLVVLSLCFLYACGGPWSREHEAVYLGFLMGTPAALGAVAVWLALFRNTPERNIAAVAILTIGYLLYCTEVVFGSRSRGSKLHLHYFSAAGIVLILTVLLGALYLS